jgi:sugar diacid utilization regulator
MLVGVATQASMSTAAAVGAPTLADLLALPALAGARLVPRDADTSATVRAVALVDPLAPIEADALLVAPDGVSDLPAGVVGVLTRTAPDAEPEVPVVVLPEPASWSVVLAAVTEAVTSGARAGADAARAALRGPLLAGDGAAVLAEVASGLLGVPVAILDPYLDTVGASGLSDAQATALDGAVDAARSAEPSSVSGQFLSAKLAGTLREPVPGPAGNVGVVVVWRSDKLSLLERAALGEVVEACALEHARDEARVETEARLRGELVEELIAGEVVSRDSIVRRARLLGADLSNGAVAMIGTLQDPQTPERASVDPLLERRFLSQVRAVIDLHWPRALVDWNEGRLLVLLPTPPETADDETGVDERAHTLARRLLSATKETVPGLAVTLALSRHTAEPEKLGAALDEAELALSIGERLGRHGDVVTFEETGTYKLLFQIFADKPEELSSFYDQTLAALVRYDEQYQTELVATLATYLELDGNLAATAGTLYTHRHTVRYRLDRIAELCGLDVGKSDDREKLSLGLKAMRLLGRPVRTGPAEKPPGRGRG